MKLLLKRHELHLVPLKDLVVFPRMVVTIAVGRRRSLRSAEEAIELGRPIVLAPQKRAGVEDPSETDVHSVGTVARILSSNRLGDGKMRLQVEGLERASIGRFTGATSRSLPGAGHGNPRLMHGGRRNREAT